MSLSLIAKVAKQLPLRISTVEWTDPTLVLAGQGWSLSLTCPWRAVTPQGSAFGWDSPDVEDRAWDLIGAEVISVVRQASGAFADPAFVLSNGVILEVLSDSELDPWNLRVEGVTVLGPLQPEDWT